MIMPPFPPIHIYISSTKNQTPNLDTLPPLGAFPAPRILKSGMRQPPSLDSAAVLQPVGIKTLQQQPLVPCHPAEVIPLLIGVVGYRRRLADVPRRSVSVFHGDYFLVPHGIRRGEGQREGFHRVFIERFPHVDDSVPAGEEAIRFVGAGDVPADSLGRGKRGLVYVDPLNGGAGSVGGG